MRGSNLLEQSTDLGAPTRGRQCGGCEEAAMASMLEIDQQDSQCAARAAKTTWPMGISEHCFGDCSLDSAASLQSVNGDALWWELCARNRWATLRMGIYLRLPEVDLPSPTLRTRGKRSMRHLEPWRPFKSKAFAWHSHLFPFSLVGSVDSLRMLEFSPE